MQQFFLFAQNLTILQDRDMTVTKILGGNKYVGEEKEDWTFKPN